MRLARLVAAGVVLGVAVGFVTALLRPRRVRSEAEPHQAEPHQAEPHQARLRRGVPRHRHPDQQLTADRRSAQVTPAGDGADLPTRPLPLQSSPALSGTGGSR
jgi:hypothetical protein